MSTYNIVGVDPGSNSMALSIFTLSEHLKILKIEALTLSLGSHGNNLDDRLNMAYGTVSDVFSEIKPIVVGIESPFVQRRSATEPLYRMFQALHLAIVKHSPNAKIVKYPPSTVKKGVGAYAFAKKGPVKHAVRALPISKYFEIDTLNNDEIDAIAVCYCVYLDIINEPISLL